MLYKFDMLQNISMVKILFIFIVLFIILVAIYIVIYLLAHFSPSKLQKHNRLALVESVNLDSKRKLALVRCDDKEHLILFAPENNILLETINKNTETK